MRLTKIFCVFLTLVIHNYGNNNLCLSQSNYIVVGNISNNDNYGRFKAGDSLAVQSGPFTPATVYQGESNILIDIDSDGKNDFNFDAWGGGGLGSGGTYCKLISLNNSFKISAHLDTSIGMSFHWDSLGSRYIPDTFVKFAPNTFSINDNISGNLFFTNDTTYLWSNSYGSFFKFPSISMWEISENSPYIITLEYYFGFSKTTEKDTAFGWLRVKIINDWRPQIFKLFAIDYAINLMSNRISDIEKNEIVFYPNPVNDYLSIKILFTLKNATFTLFDTKGFIIYKEYLNNEDNSIFLKAINSGIYIACIEVGEKRIFRKLVKI